MRDTTNKRISHTIYPDGLRIDYDYVQDEPIFIPKPIKRINLKQETVQIVLLFIALIIYIIF